MCSRNLIELPDGTLLLGVGVNEKDRGRLAWLWKSRDGPTWDFHKDRILIEGTPPWGMASGGGFGNTLQLKDGTLISCYTYRGADKKTHLEVVRWKLPALKK